MLHGARHSHPSTHSAPGRVPQYKCSSRRTYASHRASSRAQNRSHKRLWQAERQRQRSGRRHKFAKSLCYSVAAAGSAGSNRDGPAANVQVCICFGFDAISGLRQNVTNPALLQELDRRRFLLRHVQDVQPGVMQEFVELAPPHVSWTLLDLHCTKRKTARASATPLYIPRECWSPIVVWHAAGGGCHEADYCKLLRGFAT